MGHDGNLAGKLSHELSGGCFPQPCHGVLYRTHMWHIRTLTHPCLTAAATSPSRTPLPTAQSKTRRLSLPRHQRPFLRAPYCGPVAPAFSSGPDHGDTSPAVPICRGACGALHSAVLGQGKSKRVSRGQQPCTPKSQGDNPTLSRNQDPTPEATAVREAAGDGPALQAALTARDLRGAGGPTLTRTQTHEGPFHSHARQT